MLARLDCEKDKNIKDNQRGTADVNITIASYSDIANNHAR